MANPIAENVAPADRDDVVIDAALWRAQACLSPHWVHALRGSLNAASLNVALLRNLAPADPDTADVRMWETLKDEIRSLDRSLTWFLDRSSVEEAVTSDGSDLQPVIDLVRAQLEPMARKRQVVLDFREARQSFIVQAEAARTHALFLLLCLDTLEHAPARSTVRVVTSAVAPKRVAIVLATIVDQEAGALAAQASAAARDPWRDAALRAARAIGGELSIDPAGTRLEIAAS